MREDLYKAVELVIERRVAVGRFAVTLVQLQGLMPSEDKEELKECMRELARSGKYKAGLTVNKIPMIKLRVSNPSVAERQLP